VPVDRAADVPAPASAGTPYARWVPWLAALAAMAAFAQALSLGFVYDDHRFFVANDALEQGSVLWRAFLDPAVQTADDSYAGLWRPLRTLSFALDRALFEGATGSHAVNLLLHGCGTALVAALLRQWRCGALGALLGALVYAFHPIQVECVAWISSRGDLLAAALMWAALLAHGRGLTLPALACGGAALLSKEQAVVWPLLVPLSLVLTGVPLRRALRQAIVPALLVVLFVVVRAALLEEPLQEGGLGKGAVDGFLLARMLGVQALTVVLPGEALFDWQMPYDASALHVTCLVGVACLALLVPRSTRVPAAWFLAALVPTLFVQAVVSLNILVADRFLLFALPALAYCVARGITLRPVVVAPAAVIALSFLAATEWSLPHWKNDETLWTRTAAQTPGHWRAHTWLGRRALERRDLLAATSHLKRAAEARPDSGLTQFLAGQAYEARFTLAQDARDLRRARIHYGNALALFRDRTQRQEGRAAHLPVTGLAYADVTLGVGDVGGARRLVEQMLAGRPPRIPPNGRAGWEQRLSLLAAHVEKYLDAGSEPPGRLAPRLREWGRLP